MAAQLRAGRPPTIRQHKTKGLSYIFVGGRQVYLGRAGDTVAVAAEYARVIGEWRARGGTVAVDLSGTGRATPAVVTVAHVAAGYWQEVERTTEPRSSKRYACKAALKALLALYPTTPADSFGPVALAAVRDRMIADGLKRATVGEYVGVLRRVFKWGVQRELYPVALLHALREVTLPSRAAAVVAEGERIGPVPLDRVKAIRPHVSRQVWAVVQLQLLTGARQGEVLALQPCDLDTSRGEGKPWAYRPTQHKTAYRGKLRYIPIYPPAQAVLAPFLAGRAATAYLFSPAEAEAERRATRHAKRRTPAGVGNRPGYSQAVRDGREPGRVPADRYSPTSYRKAIQRGTEAAFPAPARVELDALAAAYRLAGTTADAARVRAESERPDLLAAEAEWRAEHDWHPHQLRHNYGTTARAEHGTEGAQVMLGHDSPDATVIYAARDERRADEIAATLTHKIAATLAAA